MQVMKHFYDQSELSIIIIDQSGFGNQVSQPPPRSFSTQDFISGNLGGLTNSISNFSLGSASGLGSRVAEVGWKFTNLAGQKASELSEAVTEKVNSMSMSMLVSSMFPNFPQYC